MHPVLKPFRKNSISPLPQPDSTDFCPLNPDALRSLLLAYSPDRQRPVILCIGTDRLIGDSLGPLVGTLLKKSSADLTVYGTLRSTVHAQNLADITAQIKKKHPGNPVIAVDASFGPYYRVGSVTVRPGALQPGAGVSKKLPCAGDISITGIIAAEGSHPYLSLQTTRLSLIMNMAEYISGCVLECVAADTVSV